MNVASGAFRPQRSLFLSYPRRRKNICSPADVLLLKPLLGTQRTLCEMEDSLVERSVELPFSLFQKEHPKSPWKSIALLIRMCVVLMELTLPPTPKVSIWPSSGEWEQCRVSVSQICNQKQACFIGPSSCFFWDSSVTSRLTMPALP